MQHSQRRLIPFHRLLWLALTLALVCVGFTQAAAPALAQAPVPPTNLLSNPAFDAPWSKKEDVCHPGVRLEEVQVPNGWEPFWTCKAPGDADPINRTPEYRMVDMAYPYRVRSAPTALRYFNFWALNQSAGVYQRVGNLTTGTRLRFSLWVQLWTTNTDEITSEHEPGFLEARICIKQNGGMFGANDGSSPDTVCSPWARPWDRYALLSVEGEAHGSEVTVALNTRAAWPVKHNDTQADDAVLEVISAENATPPPSATAPANTPTPTPTPPPKDPPPSPIVTATAPPPTPSATAIVSTPTPVPPVIPASLPALAVRVPLANIRASTSVYSAIVNRGLRGSEWTVLGVSPDQMWWHVGRANGRSGWVLASLVEPNPAALALRGTERPTAMLSRASAAYTAPGSGRIVARLLYGHTYAVLEKSADSRWVKLALPGSGANAGWVSANALWLNQAAAK